MNISALDILVAKVRSETRWVLLSMVKKEPENYRNPILLAQISKRLGHHGLCFKGIKKHSAQLYSLLMY